MEEQDFIITPKGKISYEEARKIIGEVLDKHRKIIKIECYIWKKNEDYFESYTIHGGIPLMTGRGGFMEWMDNISNYMLSDVEFKVNDNEVDIVEHLKLIGYERSKKNNTL